MKKSEAIELIFAHATKPLEFTSTVYARLCEARKLLLEQQSADKLAELIAEGIIEQIGSDNCDNLGDGESLILHAKEHYTTSESSVESPVINIKQLAEYVLSKESQ